MLSLHRPTSNSSVLLVPIRSVRVLLPILYPVAEAYCWQPAGTLNPGTGPRWDPWPYICSMSRPLFCFVFSFVEPPY
jgi:hypothetical protein